MSGVSTINAGKSKRTNRPQNRLYNLENICEIVGMYRIISRPATNRFSNNRSKTKLDIIEFHGFQNNSHSYIQIHNPNMKYLIDSGSTKSFICPENANKYFNNFIYSDLCTIKTALSTH